MFKCQICNQTVPPKTRCVRVVVETREKEYPFRAKVNHRSRKLRDRGDDQGGKGSETVRELWACPHCAAQLS